MLYGYVYIISNLFNSVIYIGVTSDLLKRIYQHKHGRLYGFSKRYNLTKLVYYETYDEMLNAIIREKQIKGWRRDKKIKLINAVNPGWNDLYDRILRRTTLS